MLATRATRPARLSETIRRVRLENDSAKKNCPARRNQPSGRRQPWLCALSSATRTRSSDADAFSWFRPGSGCVRSSNGENCRLSRLSLQSAARAQYYPRRAEASVNKPPAHDPEKWTPVFRKDHAQTKDEKAKNENSGFLEAVADAVKRLDHLEIVVDHL